MSIPKKITLSGSVYIKYIDEPSVKQCGDILLYLHDDAIAKHDYNDLTVSGYIKAAVFDGLVWQNMDIAEFCLNKENKFAKKQRAIDFAELSRSILENAGGIMLFKTYRGHYTRHEYVQGEYFRKQNLKQVRVKKPSQK